MKTKKVNSNKNAVKKNSEDEITRTRTVSEDSSHQHTPLVGHVDQAPKYLHDNEYIQQGYRIRFNSITKILKSLFMLHNESVNIWTHLLGSIFVIGLCVYTGCIIQNNSDQIINVLDNKWSKFNNEFHNITSPYLHKIPSFKEVEHSVTNYAGLIKNSTINYINILDDKLGSYKEFLDKKIHCLDCIKDLIGKIGDMKDNIHSRFEDIKSHAIEEAVRILNITMQPVNMTEIVENVNTKMEKMKTEILETIDSKGMEWIDIYHEENKNIEGMKVSRFPIFIFMLGAFLCLSCSAIYHLFCVHSAEVCNKLSRLDYAGISGLIAGSCFPAYYYLMYCDTFWRNFYLTFICGFSIIVFFISLTDNFHLPERRTIRGVIYLTLGISAGLPVFHMVLAPSSINGLMESPRLALWAIGGLAYIIGCQFYINRFPERIWQGKFCLIGSSHQIWHLFVLTGVFIHYFAAIDSFHDRINNSCQA